MSAAVKQFDPTTLAGTLERSAALGPALGARVLHALDARWIRLDHLATPDESRLRTLIDRMLLPYRGPDAAPIRNEQHVAAAFFVNTYAWMLTLAAAACYLLERRVPVLAPANMALRVCDPAESRGAFELAFLSERMAVLPDDPAADLPAQVVVADIETLREWFRLQVEAHMAPLISAVYAETGFGHRAQWNLVADDCAAVFLAAGERIGDVASACQEGLALVSVAGSPMQRSRTGYIRLEHAGGAETFRARGGCCLYYRLPGRERCSTCVLLSAAERDARLRAYLAQHKT